METPLILGDLNLVRCFGIARIPYVVMSDHGAAISHSRSCLKVIPIDNPEVSPEFAFRTLLDTAKKLGGKPPLFYSNDGHLQMIIQYYDEVLEHFNLLLPDKEILSTCLDKRAFSLSAEGLGLPVPAFFQETNSLRVAECGPIILKPQSRVNWWESLKAIDKGAAKSKAITILDDAELQRWQQLFHDHAIPYIAQEYISGPESNIFSYHAFVDENAESLCAFVGRKIRTYPVTNGRSCFLSLVSNKEVLEIGSHVVRSFNLRGAVKIDFKYDAVRKRYFLLEVNPRFNLWHYLGAVSGVNIPAVAMRYLCEKTISMPALTYRTDIRWLAFGDDYLAFKEFRKAGELSTTGWLSSLMGKNVYNLFSWTDPLPFVSTVKRRLLAKLKRLTMRAMAFVKGGERTKEGQK